MSFLKRLFGRKNGGLRSPAEASTRDLDSEYVLVSGPESGGAEASRVPHSLILETRSAIAEDPAEVDVSAWEMARNWNAKREQKTPVTRAPRVVGSKSQRLAHRIETIRVGGGKRGGSVAAQRHAACAVVEYRDTSMDEDLECLYDDKWNRKTKVESRRDRCQKFGA
ncbi:LADA_0H12486g1_1 [Lachancea dasiensis]|uniref:LADA_0H12486g1_1 n=1 Tax=Lachancea dasiensis TaxID=1072105 RepID=A0A1G4K3T8_9SACH|nr:LADA_0H12486g1_1 [Lachancea dasiensis]